MHITATAGTIATAHGSVTIAANGSYTYTPNQGYHGPDSFAFTAQTDDDTAGGTVNLNVAFVNDLTVVTPQTASTSEDVPATGNVLTGAVDSEGDAITATAGTVATAHGSVTIGSDGSYTYTPNQGYHGPDSFAFTAQTDDDTAGGTVNLSVAFVNDLTVVTPQTASTSEDVPATGNVLTGAVDSEGDAITATAGTVATAHGSVTIGSDGSYTYTPNQGYHGPDSFAFTAQTDDDTAGGTVNLSVAFVNDLTVVTPQTASTSEDVPATGNVLTGAVDSEGDAITATAGTVATAQRQRDHRQRRQLHLHAPTRLPRPRQLRLHGPDRRRHGGHGHRQRSGCGAHGGGERAFRHGHRIQCGRQCGHIRRLRRRGYHFRALRPRQRGDQVGTTSGTWSGPARGQVGFVYGHHQGPQRRWLQQHYFVYRPRHRCGVNQRHGRSGD